MTGMLLPIATSLTGRVSGEPIIVTGAVATSSSSTAQLDMAVQMTSQSAQEALTLVINYLQELTPEINLAGLFADFLSQYSIHHQLLSASYNVGGPSAGYALALNTLSAILRIPLCNDFEITGAPWTKGVKKSEVGGSVIIGGHGKKTEKVLLYLRRMYMPLQNYKDLEPDLLMGYWERNKDVIAVTHFADLIPEVLCINEKQNMDMELLINQRITLKSEKYYDNKKIPNLKEDIIFNKKKMRNIVEKVILQQVYSIQNYLLDAKKERYISHEQLFKKYMNN